MMMIIDIIIFVITMLRMVMKRMNMMITNIWLLFWSWLPQIISTSVSLLF
jgi:hypothetical protein